MTGGLGGGVLLDREREGSRLLHLHLWPPGLSPRSLWAEADQLPHGDRDGGPASPGEDLHLQEADSLPQLDWRPHER